MTRSVIDYSEINDLPVIDRGRNMITNGAMRIDQRNVGEVLSWGSDTVETLDRYKNARNGTSAFSVQQVDDVPANSKFAKSCKITCTTAQASISADEWMDLIRYSGIEGYKSAPILAGTLNARATSFSFWVKSNVTGVYNFAITNHDESVKLPHYFTINAANTWQHIKVENIPGPTSGSFNSNHAKGISFRIFGSLGTRWIGATDKVWNSGGVDNGYGSNSSQANFASAVNNEFYITGLQYEVGSECTDYEHKSFEQDLQECQRYYHKSYRYDLKPGLAANAGASKRATQFDTGRYWPGENFPVPMRVNPAIKVWPGRTGVTATENYVTAYNGNNTGAASNLYATPTGWTNYINVSGLNNMISFQYEADAEY